ncbi:hypothetical protein ABK040_013300 [Willaertia magna]
MKLLWYQMTVTVLDYLLGMTKIINGKTEQNYSRACTTCSSKHRKCDRLFPHCNNCLTKKQSCSYPSDTVLLDSPPIGKATTPRKKKDTSSTSSSSTTTKATTKKKESSSGSTSKKSKKESEKTTSSATTKRKRTKKQEEEKGSSSGSNNKKQQSIEQAFEEKDKQQKQLEDEEQQYFSLSSSSDEYYSSDEDNNDEEEQKEDNDEQQYINQKEKDIVHQMIIEEDIHALPIQSNNNSLNNNLGGNNNNNSSIMDESLSSLLYPLISHDNQQQLQTNTNNVNNNNLTNTEQHELNISDHLHELSFVDIDHHHLLSTTSNNVNQSSILNDSLNSATSANNNDSGLISMILDNDHHIHDNNHNNSEMMSSITNTAAMDEEIKNLDIHKFLQESANDNKNKNKFNVDNNNNQIQMAVNICNMFKQTDETISKDNNKELLRKATSDLLRTQDEGLFNDDSSSTASSIMMGSQMSFEGLLPTETTSSGAQLMAPPPTSNNNAMKGGALTNEEYDEIYGDEDDYEYMDDILKKMMRRKNRKNNNPNNQRRKKKSAASSLPNEVKDLLGQANLYFIYRDFKHAIQTLLEVIRIYPNHADAYHTLGLIYEELNLLDKAMDFYLLAGLLLPSKAEFWQRLMELAIPHNRLELATYCLKRLILLDPKNYNIRIKQCELYMKMNKPMKAANGYKSLLKQFPNDVPVIVSLARVYYEMKHVFKAIEVLESAVMDNIQTVDMTIVNMCCELYMNEGWFGKVKQLIDKICDSQKCPIETLPPEIICKYGMCNTYLGKLDSVEYLFNNILKLNINDYHDLFFDIAEMYYVVNEYKRALNVYLLLITCELTNKPMIWLRIMECYKVIGDLDNAITYGERILLELPENVECRILLSEIYKEMGRMDKAIEVLDKSGSEIQQLRRELTNNNNSDENEDESTLFESKNNNNMSDNEDNEYNNKMEEDEDDENEEEEKDPDYQPLSEMNEDDFNIDEEEEEDLLALNNNSSKEMNRTEKIKDIRILVKKAYLLHTTGQHEEFIKTALPIVLSILDLDQENPEWLKNKKKRNSKFFLLKEFKIKRKRIKKYIEKSKADGWTWTEALNALGPQSLYNLIVTLCKTLAYSKMVDDCLEILSVLLMATKTTRKIFTFPTKEERQRKKQHLRYLYVAVSYNSGNYKKAYQNIRPIISDKPYSIPLLNLFNKITTRVGNILSNHGFMLRLLDRHPQSVPLMLLIGHNCAMSGSYKLAIAEYFRAYRFMPNEPIISLCLGICYLNIVMNRRTANRHLHVMQAFTFLYRYYELREGNQEANYNLARAYHQLRLYHLAVPYYKKVLEISDSNNHQQIKNKEDVEFNDINENNLTIDTDLKREAAYNLCLIYRESQNIGLVEYLVNKYLTI